MANRAAALLALFLMVASTVGCVGVPQGPPDLTEFQAAQSLELDDLGAGSGTSVKRSVTVSDPRTIAEVNRLLHSAAATLEPVPATPPGTRLMLFSIKGGKVTGVVGLLLRADNGRQVYLQTGLPNAVEYYTEISENDFRTLLKILGASDWQIRPDR